MAEEYYIYNTGHKCEKVQKPALLFIFDTGYYTIASGWGSCMIFTAQLKSLDHTLVGMSVHASPQTLTMGNHVCGYYLSIMHSVS